MGNGASMENEGDVAKHQGQVQRPPAKSRPPGSDRNTPSGSRAASRRGSIASVSTWRSAFKSSKVPQSGLRKMRAAALGRKSACTVAIDKTGFTLQHIRICEGQVVAFEWEAPEGSQGFNVTQVIHDGEQYRPCIGGFNSGPLAKKGFFEQQFNLAGEYKFVSAGIRCTPLRVEVYPRKEIEGELTDEGFEPKIVRLDEGNAITWHWSGCSVPHTCVEVKFSHKLGTIVSKDNADKPIPTKAGSYRKDFPKPGVFYFHTEGLSSGIMHTCVVHVRERQREYRTEILDRSFNPPILVIQEGDRVWFTWDKERCQKYHCVYQVEAPPEDAHGDEAYKQYKNGFKWPNPSRSGLLSQEFYDVGVYHFSDHNFQEAAEYMGTIIVKPKQLEHFIEIKPDGFTQDLIYAETGDRIWWAWMTDDMKNNFLISELEKCVSPVGGRPSLDDEQIGEGSYLDEDLEQMKVAVGLDTVQLASIGVYQYKLSDSANTLSTCSIVVQGGPRNHTVHVTDSGFEPKVVTVHPGDRVWWVWQEGKKQHNISQVSHQGSRIPEGFTSGFPRDCPSAYMGQFNQPGVFYYVSSGVAKAFGAVVVSSQPKVHEIQAIQNVLNPDPIVVAVNDVCAWVFKGLRQHDVVRVHTVDQLLDSQFSSPIIVPRRCINRLFTETGVHHFTSKSFLKQNVKASEHRQNEENKVSSVLVDEVSDSSIIRVSAQGFHPQSVNITKGQSVLWTWKDSGEESHNIVHVNAPDSDKPLGIIQGSQSFNSGRPVAKNSFLYTFDEPGGYCVASQGAPGFAGIVNVLPEGDKAAIPEISSDHEGGMVDKLHTVRLECDTPDSKIYYTLDGTAPELHRLHPKLYNKDKGIVLKNSGLTFVRAMATSDGHLNSNILTSGRFWVLSGDEDATSEASELPHEPVQDQTAMRLWWQCVPVAKGIFTHPGVMEVFWDSPPQEAVKLIRGYQVFLNGVTYCQMFPANHNSVSVAGLAGGRMYEITLDVYPMDPMYLPHKSNKLAMKCPKTMSTGGPIISLETTAKEDMLAVVWMAISNSESPVAGYRVYLNGTMCGSQVVPDAGSDRCKVVIEGCSLGMLYRVVVAAIPEDGTAPKMSNEIQITLPQDIESIRLPPEDIRLDDDDLYKEYLEVREGSGYVPGEDVDSQEELEGPLHTMDFTAEMAPEMAPETAPETAPVMQRNGNWPEGSRNGHWPEGPPNEPQPEHFDQRFHDQRFHAGRGAHHLYEDMVEEEGELEGEEQHMMQRQQQKQQKMMQRQLHQQQMQQRPNHPSSGLRAQGAVVMQPVSQDHRRTAPTPPQSGNATHPYHQSFVTNKRASSASLLKSLPPDMESLTSMGPRATMGGLQQAPMSPIPSQTPQDSFHVTSVVSQPAMALSPLTSARPVPPSLAAKPQPAPSHIVEKPPLPKPPMIQGVIYQSNVLRGFGAPRPETGPEAPSFQYIDGTRGPWKNRMKTMATAVIGSNLSRNVEVEVRDDDSVIGEITGEEEAKPTGKRNKKKRNKTAIVEVHDEAHLTLGAKVPKTDMPQASAVPVIGMKEGQDMLLPPPVVSAQDHGPEEILVSWRFEKDAGPMYRVFVNVVNVVGLRFRKAVGSNISFECMLDENNDAVQAVQHCWNVVEGDQCIVNGLIPGLTYRIFVVANYTLVNAGQSHELQAKSSVIRYTTLGPPPAPDLKPNASDIGQATLEWDAIEAHKEVAIDGFHILVDGKPLGNVLSKTTKKTTIDNLQPGKSIMVQVVAVTQHQVGASEPSNTVRVSCPPQPPPVFVQQQPSFKKGSVIVAWEKPNSGEHVPYGEDIVMYRIFLDGKWHGEVKSSSQCNRSGYQYYLTDLESGRSYDVSVKAYAGQRKADPTSDQLYCLVESEDSNTLSVMCPAPPTSPVLRLEGMHTGGIDIIWEMPQQYGDAAVSGYQLLRDSRLYGSIMPPDVNTLHIKDVTLGDRIQLQILALTDHPVGRQDQKDSKDGEQVTEGVDSGIETSQYEGSNGYMEMFIGDRYSACKPGPKLIVHYTGLVQAPSKVWCERVTGHSAMIVWNKDDQMKQHFVNADMFQVTWWPKDVPDAQINSQSTKDDHLMLAGLRPNTLYAVVVEARKMQNYSDIQEGEISDDGYGHTFILTGKSEALSLRTAKPPGSPGNLGIVTTTCHSIQVAWDPPHESGIDILAIRIDAVAMKADDPRRHSSVEVPPSASNAVVENLSEKTEYMISVTAITEEFFENLPEGNDMRQSRSISLKKPPPEDPWLPSSSMIGMTSGTDPPSELRVIRTNLDSVTVTWSPAVVYGSNRLQGTVLRWAEAKYSKDPNMAQHKSLDTDSNEAVLTELYPGVLYRLVVEAVVSVKSTIDFERKDPETEKKNRRTTHVASHTIFVRTRAPCESPSVLITNYSPNTITLYWEKPLLYSTIGKDEHGNPKCLKLSLEGYRLEINGKPHMRLLATAQSCTLVKCRPGKTYKVVLVALTCTDEVKKERRKRIKGTNLDNSLSTLASMATTSQSGNKEWETTSEDLENDESASLPMEIALPESHDGLLSELNVMYKMPVEGGDDLGDLSVEWDIRGRTSFVSQFNVKWVCEADGHTQKKVVNAHSHHTSFPVTRRKCVYDVYVEPEYNVDMVPGVLQKVQCLIPGPPDPPEIFVKNVGLEEFVIEWGEPRLYGVRIDGYQVMLNGKKVGGMLHSSHRKAVIPCKAKKTYKVSLVAISADKSFGDSGVSNTLLITPGGTEVVCYVDGPAEEEKEHDESDLSVKIVKISENSIHLEWTNYAEPEGMFYYKVTWTTVSQPDEREVKLPQGEKSCVLHKCLPGAKHHLRVWAMGKEERVLDVSSQITIQTSAPPDTPVVTLRACNFRYIAIQWEKPSMYGDAEISGYKIYVNGVVESVLGANQHSFMFTQGRWCREYAFQIQAVTKDDHLISKPSDPLVVTWPGVQAPVLRKVPAVSSNGLKVTWDTPQETSGVKIKHFKLVCLEEETERTVQVLSPIHADTTEAELHNLKQGSYLIFLEVHVHGSNDVIRSDALKVKPTLTPDPPMISVTVIGLEERRRIERVTCDLINKRDRLLNFLHNRDMLSSMKIVDEDQVINKVTEDLTHVEDMLDDCLSSMTNYTGHLLIHVSWTCPQSNSDIKVTGYKVLVDGKQYGTMLHGGVKNVRIKLGLCQPTHKLSMIAVSEAPQTTSAMSNIVELLTEPFQPFTFFMFLSNRPNAIGVSYQDSLIEERKFSQGLINQGLMRRQVPPPACTLMNVFDGKYIPLFPHSGPSVPTAILFWVKWNVASKKSLGWFFRFAKLTSSYYDFIAVESSKGEGGGVERHDLTQVITDNGWRDDDCIRHLSSHAADANGALVDAAELFGISGTPLLMVVHPEGYIAWKGRYCAFDFATFENFMRFIMSQALNQISSVPDPWDTNIDVDALDGVSKRRQSETQAMIHRPTTNARMGLKSTSTHQVNGRPMSAKKMFIKTNQHKYQKNNDQISVNRRPYSGSSITDSPYTEKLAGANTVPPRRVRSGKKVNGKYY